MKAGIILHYQDPENFLVALLDDNGSGTVTPKLVKFVDGKSASTLATGSTFSMTDGSTYTVKCAIHDDPGNAALQELKLYVGGTLRLTTTTVDDATINGSTISAGKVGLFRLTTSTTTTLQWDNFKCGKDNNADDDADDGGDYVFANYDFASTTLSLSYDDNGNLTDDGLRKYVYDAWNRLVGCWYHDGSTSDSRQRFAQYVYDGLTRRVSKAVSLRGAETYANDGGNTTVHFYYGAMSPRIVHHTPNWAPPWNIFETRNGGNQSTRQWCWGTQYIDELVFMDRNGGPSLAGLSVGRVSR